MLAVSSSVGEARGRLQAAEERLRNVTPDFQPSSLVCVGDTIDVDNDAGFLK